MYSNNNKNDKYGFNSELIKLYCKGQEKRERDIVKAKIFTYHYKTSMIMIKICVIIQLHSSGHSKSIEKVVALGLYVCWGASRGTKLPLFFEYIVFSVVVKFFNCVVILLWFLRSLSQFPIIATWLPPNLPDFFSALWYLPSLSPKLSLQ